MNKPERENYPNDSAFEKALIEYGLWLGTKSPSSTYTIKMPTHELDAVRAQAKKEGRPMSKMIRDAIKEYIQFSR